MLDFPSSPTSGQYYTSSVRSWRYNGSIWELLTDPWLDADSFSGKSTDYFRDASNLTGYSTTVSAFAHGPVASYTDTGISCISYPSGAYYCSNNPYSTGSIEISLPINVNNVMIAFDVSIYSYESDKVIKVYIGGYTYTGSPYWTSTSSHITCQSEANYSIRFGADGTRQKVWIGELTGKWSYPKVTVENVRLGFSNNLISKWATGWSINLVTGMFGTVVDYTESNTQIGKYHAGNLIWNAGNDGTGSTLDADLLDGQEGVYYRNAANLTGQLTGVFGASISGNKIWHAGNDGAGSTLDADLLDGYNSATSATASTVAVRDSSANLYSNYCIASVLTGASTYSNTYYLTSGVSVLSSQHYFTDILYDSRYNPGVRLTMWNHKPNAFFNAEKEGYTVSWNSHAGVTNSGNIWIPNTTDRYTQIDRSLAADPLIITISGSIPPTTNVGAIRGFLQSHGSIGWSGVQFEVQRNDYVWVTVPNGFSTNLGLYVSDKFNTWAAYPTYTNWRGMRLTLSGATDSTNAYYEVGLYSPRSLYDPEFVSTLGDTIYGTLVTETMYPRTASTYDLGSSSYKYNNLYLAGSITVAGTVDGRDVSTDGTKLDGIEAGATADQSAAEILAALLTVDGPGSLLDADLLDGVTASYFLNLGNLTGTTTSSKISDFTEAAQDAIGTSFFTFAGTVTGSYNDGSNTFLLSGIASTGAGVTSHTALTDLTADDHLQYLTSGRADTWLLQNSSFTGFTGSFTSNVESLISNTQLEDLLDIIYTNSPDEVQYNTLVYNVGGYWEPSKTISTHIAETGYHYTQASISITTGQVVGFIEAVQDIIGTGTFLKGSNGISGIYNDTSNILTLSGIDATYVQRGVASFDSAYFSVTTGKVSLASVPLAVIEQNTGPYILGLSAVGVDDSPSAMSTSTVANLLTGSLTTPSFVTGIVTGLATGYLKAANNLSDVPDLSLTRQNLRVRYNMDDLSPFDSQGIWTSVSAGSGSTYQFDPQYGAASTRGPGAHGIVTCSCNLGSGIGDCSVRYHTNAGLWLSTGSEFYFRAMHTNTLSAGNIFRFGLANAIANATGQIADGIYFELNGSTGAAIMCCTASGSTYSRTVSSYSPTVANWTWYIIKFLGTGVAFYTDGDNTPIATLYNNYPGATARASRVFWQCAGTGLPNYRAIMVDKIAYPYIESSLPSGLYL